MLARHFLARFAALHGTAVTGFTTEAQSALLKHAWPGNVRELENRIHGAALLARPASVTAGDLGLEGSAEPKGLDDEPSDAQPFLSLQRARSEATERFERAYLEDALRRTGGRVALAAEQAGVSRQLFQRLLRRHGVDWRLFRGRR